VRRGPGIEQGISFENRSQARGHEVDKRCVSDISIASTAELSDDKVESWRLSVLLDAGYPWNIAGVLAESKVDLHAAVDLVERGCPAPLAARILL
jgi:hypothetical protein